MTASASPSLIARLRTADWIDRARTLAYAKIFAGVLVASSIGWIALSHGLLDPAGHPIGTDFLNVYAAGLLADRGTPALAYDWAAHGVVEHSVVAYDGYFGWHYPPMFLFIAAPLARLPYLGALAVYLCLTFAAYLIAMGALARSTGAGSDGASLPRTALPGAGLYWLAAGLPAVFVNLGHGQNGFLTTALLAGGFSLLGRRPVMAGLLLGALVYKPQFGLLIPVALVAGGYWRAVVAAGLAALVLSLASLIVFGPASWMAFFASLEPTRTIILEQGATGWEKIVSVFSAVRMWGGSLPVAYTAQTGVTLAAMALVAVVWWRSRRPMLAIGVFGLAIPLTTPYVLDYDLVVTGISVFALAIEGAETGFRPWEKLVLALVVIEPLIARGIGAGLMLPIVPPILMLALWIFARRAFAEASRPVRMPFSRPSRA